MTRDRFSIITDGLPSQLPDIDPGETRDCGETTTVGVCHPGTQTCSGDGVQQTGEVDHRDTLLTIPERDGGMMLVCVSRAAPGARLTLDL